MKTLLRLCALVDRINERIGRWASWLTLIAVLVCTVNAMVRYSLHMSSNAWLELQWYLNAGMFLLVAAHALKINAHVRIDVIAGRLSPRAQAWIDVFGGLFFLLPMALIIAWYSWPSLVSSWRINEMSSDPGGLIRWPVRVLIPVAFVLLALQGLSEVIKRCAFLAGRAPNPAEAKREAPDAA
jgi:TRAP-type mannitol/chloroaromatic compound transport system permease small subunit